MVEESQVTSLEIRAIELNPEAPTIRRPSLQ